MSAERVEFAAALENAIEVAESRVRFNPDRPSKGECDMRRYAVLAIFDRIEAERAAAVERAKWADEKLSAWLEGRDSTIDGLRAEVARHVAFGSRLQDDVLQLTAELAGLNETERLNGMQHSIDTLMVDNEIVAKKLGVERTYSESLTADNERLRAACARLIGAIEALAVEKNGGPPVNWNAIDASQDAARAALASRATEGAK